MRYKIIEGSESAHCCFDYTIVDTERPNMHRGEILRKSMGDNKGEPWYHTVCECFSEADAKLICKALNRKDK